MPLRVRPARKGDATQLAVLMDIASQGLVSHLWNAMAAAGESPLEFGRSRIRDRRNLPSHFSNWMVLENGPDICGAFAGYRVPSPYDPGDTSELPASYSPLLELEALAAGSWFLAVLAVFPEARRRGIAAALLKAAEQAARTSGAAQMALTVSMLNGPARALYGKAGFSEKTRRKRIAISGGEDADEWILLAKDL